MENLPHGLARLVVSRPLYAAQPAAWARVASTLKELILAGGSGGGKDFCDGRPLDSGRESDTRSRTPPHGGHTSYLNTSLLYEPSRIEYRIGYRVSYRDSRSVERQEASDAGI